MKSPDRRCVWAADVQAGQFFYDKKRDFYLKITKTEFNSGGGGVIRYTSLWPNAYKYCSMTFGQFDLRTLIELVKPSELPVSIIAQADIADKASISFYNRFLGH